MFSEPDLSLNQYNERVLLEKNLDEFEKYFPGLKGIPESLYDINPDLPTKKDWAGLVALCSLDSKEPEGRKRRRNECITAQTLADFSGLGNKGNLVYRAEKLYRMNGRAVEPEFEGARIGLLLKDVGFLDSNLSEFANNGIEVGSSDVVKRVQLPSKIDENIAWLAGMVSISSYAEGKKVKGNKVTNSYGRFRLSFGREDRDLVELEFLPVFEDNFNYRPPLEEGRTNAHPRAHYSKRDAAMISPKAIVSYFRDYLGICPEQEKRKMLFEDECLESAFVGGIIDRTGHYVYYKGSPIIEINLPYKYPPIIAGLEKHFGKKFDVRNTECRMRLHAPPEKIVEYGLHDPKWYLPLMGKTSRMA